MAKDGVVSISIEYKKELNQMIKDYESALSEMASDTKLSKGMQAEFNATLSELRKFKAEMDKTFKELDMGKVDVKSFKSFKQSVKNNFDSVKGEINRLDSAISTMNSQLNILSNGIDISKLNKDFNNFYDYVTKTNDAISEMVKTLNQQGISLFSFDNTSINESLNIIKKINNAIKSLDSGTHDNYDLNILNFNEKELQNEADNISATIEHLKSKMDSLKDSMNNPNIGGINLTKIKAEYESLTLEMKNAYDKMEDILNNDDLKFQPKFSDVAIGMEEFDEYEDDITKFIERAKLVKQELQSIINSSNKSSGNSNGLATNLAINTDDSELWDSISKLLSNLQEKLDKNPIVAPVKLVVAPNTSVADKNGEVTGISNSYSKKYKKVLASSNENAVIDLEGVYRKTFTSIMDEATAYAKETVNKIQTIFESSPIKLHFDFNETEFKEISNALLSSNSEKKINITSQIAESKKEVNELASSLENVEKILTSTEKKNISFKGFDKFSEEITKSLNQLTELKSLLKALQNIETTLAKVGNVSSVTEIENQWEKVNNLVEKTIKLDGTFYKNSNVEKLASEYSKYLEMGGNNELSSANKFGKIKDGESSINIVLSKLKELNAQKIDSSSIDKADTELKSVSSTLDDVISKFDYMIELTRRIGNTFYGMLKETSISSVDKQWSAIETKFKTIADNSGKINLSKQKKDVQELMEMYQKYSNAGGMNTPFNLTDNAETIKKLNKVYEQINLKSDTSSASNESKNFNKVEDSVNSLTTAINTKTDAIKLEANTMELAARAEIKSIQKIIDALEPLIKKIESIPELNLLKETSSRSSLSNESNISSEMKNAFQGSDVTDTKPETQGMEQVKKATEEAVQAKKNFATANEGVQSSIDGSENPLKLETELMEQIAKSAREAADAKKEFVKADAQVKKSSDDTKDKDEAEKQKNIYQQLLDTIKRYSIVSQRVSKGNGLDGDLEEITRLEDKISSLQKEPILSISQIEESERKLVNLFDILDDNERKLEKRTYQNRLNYFNSLKQKYINQLSSYTNGSKYTDFITNRATSLTSEIGNLDFSKQEDILRLQKIKSEIDSIISDSKLLENRLIKQSSKLDDIILKMKDFRSRNTNMTSSQKNELNDLISSSEKLASTGNATASEIESIKSSFTSFQAKVIESGNTGLKFIDQVRQRLGDMNSKFIAQFFSWQDWLRYLRQAADMVIEINTQITELAKVSEQNSKQIYNDFDSYASIAKNMGATISDTISATSDWSRNGYNIPDSKELAEVALLYKNVGDGIDIDTANESLISTLKGFQLQADQAEHIIDVFNEVSNNEAISSAGIGTALQRSAASFNAANTSLEKSVALVTATNTVLQDEEKTGNMWKTVSARLRGAKTELTDMGEDTDGLVESTSKLRDLVKGITGFDIMKDENTYKDIYDIVIGIGEKWNDLNDIDRASLLESLAGKNQSNALAAALSNVDVLKKAYGEATNAEGSAREEQEEWEKSVQYSIDKAKASLEELANDFLSSDFLKGLIDAGQTLIEILDFIIKDLGTIPTLIAGISGYLSLKNNVGLDKNVLNSRPHTISYMV